MPILRAIECSVSALGEDENFFAIKIRRYLSMGWRGGSASRKELYYVNIDNINNFPLMLM